MTQSRDKCEQPCCEESSCWLGFILATTVFMAVLMGVGFIATSLMTKLVSAIGHLVGIGW